MMMRRRRGRRRRCEPSVLTLSRGLERRTGQISSVVGEKGRLGNRDKNYSERKGADVRRKRCKV